MDKTLKATQKNQKERIARNRTRALALLLTVIFIAAVCLLVSVAVSPQRFQLSVGDVSPETITAPHDTIDEAATEKLRESAKENVALVFTQDSAITSQSIQDFQTFMKGVETLRNTADQIRTKKVGLYAAQNGTEAAAQYELEGRWQNDLTEEEMTSLKGSVQILLYDDEVLALINASKSDVERFDIIIGNLIKQALEIGIKQEHKLDIADDIKTKIDAELTVKDSTLIQIGKRAVDAFLYPNMVYDETQTNKNKESAASSITPVTIKTGQNIVMKGEAVTEGQYAMMQSLGLLSSGGLDMWLYLEVCLFVIGISIPAAIYATLYSKETVGQLSRLMLLLLIQLIVIAAAVPLSRYQPRIIPVFLASLLIAATFSERLAVVITVYLSLVVSIMAGYGQFQELQSVFNSIALISAGWAGIFAIRKMQHRSRLIVGGAVSGVVYALLNFALGMIMGKGWSEMLLWAAWGGASGVASAILCLGTIPVWETIFRIATPTKLLELGNTNQPLIKRLMIEAPGTYHHAVMSANLAEAAAESIGANALLCRVGAFYHDIGKLKNPKLYIENQIGLANPHDTLPPTVSADIIKEHVTYGEQLAQAYRIPKLLQDMIGQHHGTAPIIYFYHKAANAAKDEVDVERFRYDGPKPRTKEAGILMLSDGIEAALHAKEDASEETIITTVKSIMKERIDDGQLDECPLSLMDIKTIEGTFIKVLSGAYHSRVEYPKGLSEMKREKHDA
jgi:cyclic-di-AMP phosphodiesterase PgpH